MSRRRGVEYRRGQRPTWLDGAEPNVAPTEAAVEDDIDAIAFEDDGDRRPATVKGVRSRIRVRVAEAYLEGQQNANAAGARKAPVIRTDGLEVPDAVVEVEEDVDERRRRARLKSSQVEVEVAADDIPDLERIVEERELQELEVIEDEEESEEEEEEEDDDDYDYGRVLMKPVFVSRENRQTVEEKTNVVESNAVDRSDDVGAEERKKEIEQKVIDAIQRDETERELAAKAARLEIPDDTDVADDPVEYEKWRLREMVRILRDREVRRLAEEERAETERRRLLPDEVFIREQEEKQAAAPPKPKIKFLQRYHHKGVFYTDAIDQDLLQRDHQVATGWDADVDRSLLPKVLQVKNFGLASRTKYTHLTDQDTSRDNPWAEEKDFPRPTGFSSRAKPDTTTSNDREAKRPRT